MLARAWREHPTELRADMQRYYRLDMDALGSSFGIWQAASCLACMPLGSAVLASERASLRYGNLERMLGTVIDMLSGQRNEWPWVDKVETKAESNLPEFVEVERDDWLAWHEQQFTDKEDEWRVL